MRIVHIIPSLDPADGGPPVVVERLGAAQAALGAEVAIMFHRRPGAEERAAKALADTPGASRLRLVELDPADRRRASLRLTEQGRIVHNDIDLFASRLDGLLTSSLTARESAMLDSILTKINVQLRDIIENHRWQDYIDPD